MSVEPESVAAVCGHLRRCLELREKYMSLSGQYINPKDSWSVEEIEASGRPLDVATVPKVNTGFTYSVTADGIYQWSGPKQQEGEPIPTVQQYYDDFEAISQLCSDGPTKTWAFRRLRLLSAHFQLHILQNEQAERQEQRKAPHRDFYNVRKVDTHVHHSSAMNCKHLLRFIKNKLKQAPNDKVIIRDGQELTLQQVFDSLKLTAYDLSIDALDMHAHKDTFHRFDRFNLKYNPLGEARLREIFMKTDNYIKGRYLAEITKQVFDDLTMSKYQMAEYRLSIYGRNPNEWNKLADWVISNNLYCDNVRWMVQIPRLYHLYRATGSLKNFQVFLDNIFEPLFKVTLDPSSDPKLHHFLKRVVGFDTVDDESKRERRMYKHVPRPSEWTNETNPPYSYYMYYLYANIASLNRFRQALGYNTFTIRPHSGEAGDPDHLVAAFLTSQGINHGVLLRKIPVMQYLYYLAKIPVSMSPLSNNALFLSFDRNPFLDYFQRGLVVTLSTDDPLQFHYTREPLMEEYSVGAQIWKLSSCDMCEIARNSVLGCGWEAVFKERWIGKARIGADSDGSSVALSTPATTGAKSPASSCRSLTFDNDIEKTNVPDVRVLYRQQRHAYEMAVVYSPTGSSPPLFMATPMLTVERLSGENLLLKEQEEEFMEDVRGEFPEMHGRISPAPSDP